MGIICSSAPLFASRTERWCFSDTLFAGESRLARAHKLKVNRRRAERKPMSRTASRFSNVKNGTERKIWSSVAFPFSSVTRMRTRKSPEPWNVCRTSERWDVTPSPKSHNTCVEKNFGSWAENSYVFQSIFRYVKIARGEETKAVCSVGSDWVDSTTSSSSVRDSGEETGKISASFDNEESEGGDTEETAVDVFDAGNAEGGDGDGTGEGLVGSVDEIAVFFATVGLGSSLSLRPSPSVSFEKGLEPSSVSTRSVTPSLSSSSSQTSPTPSVS